MDEWNRNGQDEYTGVTAQRRNRRRSDSAGEHAEAKPEPIAAEEPAQTEEAAAAAEIDVPDGTETRAEAETPLVPDVPGEPVAAGRNEESDVPAEPVVQAADSRVPPEARRMAAAPYGVPRADAKRPGTRPQVAPRRPPMPEDRRLAPRPRRETPLPQETMRTSAVVNPHNPRERSPRVNVGYAPGRMSDEAPGKVPASESIRESVYGRDAKSYLERRKQPFRMEDEKKPLQNHPDHKAVRVIVTILVLAGLILTGWMLLKGGNGTDGTAGREALQIISFDPPNTQGMIAPETLTFSVQTGKNVQGIRLHADGDRDPETEIIFGDNADVKVWTIKMPVPTGFQGTVMLQARRSEDEEWIDTGYTAEISVSTPLGIEVPEENNADQDDDDYYDEDAEKADTSGEAPEQVTPAPADLPEQPEEQPEEQVYDEPAVLNSPEPTPTPAPTTEAATPTPALTAEAAPEANPNLITSTTVWTGVAKKDKDYNRAAKELIHMPAADEYTKDQKNLGVLTFRGDNFRRNAAAGTLSAAPLKLSVLWQAEAGSARGINKTYYGYEWTGQPVIARWSTEVRTKSNITESKIEKSALKEVIIAGVDGSVRFLDLEDGNFTRNSIRLNYPMKGTPSLDPRGYPFLTVGQLTRKMKGRTAGKIGLRQYNLYSQKELKIIDGLDGKYHRPLNDIGSFETSALIDRESDTLIVAGTNGMLYLESLGSSFDYNLGVLTVSPSVVAMSSRAKGQKSNALLAVESSLAAYDRYVYYADMGGVLRCVDTNTLRPVWAVDTGDSVMAAVALDLTKNRELNLYTANMLNNRKKGDANIQIRRYDALSGREIWCTDVGVFKSKKDREKDNVGAKASPVIGQNQLEDYVFFTVTGLSGEGAKSLGLNTEAPAALIALDKGNGRVAWAFGLESRSESSPIALYDKMGNGWIVQCEQNGKIHLLDGRTGSLVNTLQVEGEIQASPAAYNNVVVVGTTGKGKAFVYGIEVKLDKPQESAETPAPEATEVPEDGPSDEDAGNDEAEPYEDYEEYEDFDVDSGEGEVG